RLEKATLAVDLRGAPAEEHARARGLRLIDLLLDEFGMPRLRDRPHVHAVAHRIAEAIRLHVREAGLDELLVERSIDVGALDGAAALSGVVASAVDHVLDRLVEIGVARHVRRVLSAELEPDVDEALLCRRMIDAMPAEHR